MPQVMALLASAGIGLLALNPENRNGMRDLFPDKPARILAFRSGFTLFTAKRFQCANFD